MVFSRRQLLASVAAQAVSFTPFGQGCPGLGLQLYTLGSAPSSDLDGVLRKVAAIGFSSVEFAGFYGRSAPQIRAALQGAGLIGSGAHCLPLTLSDEAAARQIAFCVEAGLGRPVTALPAKQPSSSGAPAAITEIFNGMSRADWRWTADRANRFGELVKMRGLNYCYHNHNLDFRPVDGTQGLDLFMQWTHPGLVSLELDIGNLVAAGADPHEYLDRYRGRIRAVHLKDWRRGFTPSYGLQFPQPAPFGAGVMDWNRLLPAIARLGPVDLIVEQEAAVGGALAAQAQAYDFLGEQLRSPKGSTVETPL